MKKIFLYTFTLASIAVACNIVEPSPSNNEANPALEGRLITETISGCWSPSTKATIADADASFKWSVGDNIAVHVSNNTGGHMYVFTSGEGGASVAEATASFTVYYPENYSRDAFAIFPRTIVKASAANYGQSGTALDVTLPATYDLEQISGETSPCPMIATNTAGSGWTFYQLCSLLRLTVKGIPADATGLAIQFPGRKVNGNFSIASPVTPGTSTISTGAPASGEDKITVSFTPGSGTELTLSIPLPTGTYEDVFITPVGGSTKVAAVRHISEAAYNATNTRAKKLTTTLVSFSFNDSKKVIFAPGNLQATYSTSEQNWTWRFAAHQYDKIGNTVGNTKISTDTKESSAPWAKLRNTPQDNSSAEVDGTVDLFGRSTTSTYYGIARSTNKNYYNGVFVDWGNNPIGGYASGFWSTPSSAEWAYVVGKDLVSHSYYRKVGGTVAGVDNVLCTKATVNGISGFLIFPDNYNGGTPEGVTWVTGNFSNGDYANSGATGWGTTISATAWDQLEAAGCVFLPVEGFRLGCYSGYYNIVANQTYGFYISTDFNLYLRFNDAGFDPLNGLTSMEWSGVSVRLVHVL